MNDKQREFFILSHLYAMFVVFPIIIVLSLLILFLIKQWALYNYNCIKDNPRVYLYDMRFSTGVFCSGYIEDTLLLRENYETEDINGKRFLRDWEIFSDGKEMILVKWICRDKDIAELFYLDTFEVFKLEFYIPHTVYAHRNVIFFKRDRFLAKKFWIDFTWNKYKENKVFISDKENKDKCIYLARDTNKLAKYYINKDTNAIKEYWICRHNGDELRLIRYVGSYAYVIDSLELFNSLIRENREEHWEYKGLYYIPKNIIKTE